MTFSSVQFSHSVRLFATPWIAARQASLSIRNSWSLLKLMPIESVMPSISSSVIPFSSCPQSLPTSGSFPMNQLFSWGSQSTGVSASASVLPMNTQDWFPLEWTGWIKTIPTEKRCKTAKWLSEEALRIAVKWREMKIKGEKERYYHFNAEFQRIARRDKKPFHSEQCKEIEENNWMGKTRDLFKKIRDTKGTFYTKMGSIKDRNCMDLTEA